MIKTKLKALLPEDGMETLEWVSLMAVMLLLGAAAYVYISGGIGVVIDHIATILDRFIAGYAAGW